MGLKLEATCLFSAKTSNKQKHDYDNKAMNQK